MTGKASTVAQSSHEKEALLEETCPLQPGHTVIQGPEQAEPPRTPVLSPHGPREQLASEERGCRASASLGGGPASAPLVALGPPPCTAPASQLPWASPGLSPKPLLWTQAHALLFLFGVSLWVHSRPVPPQAESPVRRGERGGGGGRQTSVRGGDPGEPPPPQPGVSLLQPLHSHGSWSGAWAWGGGWGAQRPCPAERLACRLGVLPLQPRILGLPRLHLGKCQRGFLLCGVPAPQVCVVMAAEVQGSRGDPRDRRREAGGSSGDAASGALALPAADPSPPAVSS